MGIPVYRESLYTSVLRYHVSRSADVHFQITVVGKGELGVLKPAFC
jgi:hypothetical protein